LQLCVSICFSNNSINFPNFTISCESVISVKLLILINIRTTITRVFEVLCSINNTVMQVQFEKPYSVFTFLFQRQEMIYKYNIGMFLKTLKILKRSSEGVLHSELLGFWISSIISYCKERKTLNNATFRKLYLFPSSGEGVGDIYSTGSSKRCNTSQWT
jgi:hypothetical protein